MTHIRAILIGVALSGMVAAYTTGRSHGYAAAVAKVEDDRLTLQRQLHKLGDDLSIKIVELAAAQEAAAVLAEEVENEARNDPDAALRKPSTDSLQRLERRWGTR